MARRIRHVYPNDDEYVVIHRGGNNNEGCGYLLLILLGIWLISNYWPYMLAGIVIYWLLKQAR